MDSDELRLRILKALSEAETDISQHDLSESLGVCVGKVNYCITELAKSGYIKIQRFRKADKKPYAYLLTPKGMHEKFRLLVNFLARKMNEYEMLKNEITEIHKDLSQYPNIPPDSPVNINTDALAEGSN